jgi:hypothetical protein
VARLWASNKIAVLSEAIRDLGADGATANTTELVNEIVRLSTQFGILTEYTAFLAEEGTTLAAAARKRRSRGLQLQRQGDENAQRTAAVSQADNFRRPPNRSSSTSAIASSMTR